MNKDTAVFWISPILLWVMQRLMYVAEQHNEGGPGNGYFELLATTSLFGCLLGTASLAPRRRDSRAVQIAFWINVAALGSVAVSIILTWIRFRSEQG